MFRVYFLLSAIMTINHIFNGNVLQNEKPTSLLGKVDTILSKIDTIRINPDSVERDENLSPLNLKEAMYMIGDTIVNLKQFKFFATEKLSSIISKNPGLRYLARINVNGYSHEYTGAKEDTVVWFGKLRTKYLPKKNRYYNSYNSYNSEFRNGCPPSSCYYYYVCQTINGTIKIITKPEQLVMLINHVSNVADAFFLVDDLDYVTGRYAKTKNGTFILVNKRVSDCRLTYADILYFVNNKGVVKEISRNVTQITSLCI